MPHNKQGKTNLRPSFFQYFVVTKQVECPMGFFRALLVARSGHMQLVCIDTDDARNSTSAQLGFFCSVERRYLPQLAAMFRRLSVMLHDGRGFAAMAGEEYRFNSADDAEAHHGRDYFSFSWVTRRRVSPLPLKNNIL
jgi:hypothetical protein